jgi:hypothetical protein
MKAKSPDRSFVSKPLQLARTKALAHAVGASDPLSRARPFLVHALRLRSRKIARD